MVDRSEFDLLPIPYPLAPQRVETLRFTLWKVSIGAPLRSCSSEHILSHPKTTTPMSKMTALQKSTHAEEEDALSSATSFAALLFLAEKFPHITTTC